jgi:uncharacterized protein YndB with AHSA1/START domain
MSSLQTSTFFHTRLLSVPVDQVYTAFITPSLLQQRRWPKWFTNEFDSCNPVPGGEWKFTMIWPNGVKHPNESTFVEVTKEKIVIEHVCKPHYVLTVTLDEEVQATRITRQQQFDTPEIYNQIKWFVTNANEENLDRLETLLKQHTNTLNV